MEDDLNPRNKQNSITQNNLENIENYIEKRRTNLSLYTEILALKLF